MTANRVIGYYWRNEKDKDVYGPLQLSIEQQQALLKSHVEAHSLEIINELNETFDKKRKRFPELNQAIDQCRVLGAVLIIPNFQNLGRYEYFSRVLVESGIEFLCLDQPLITRDTLPAIVDNFRRMRRMHSDRIRAGLERTAAQLGNPNALKEITRVNKPKTENATMFALLIAPIISYYKDRGLSQRKMVTALNEDGYHAPEGGVWVLSQLQKVLERIELNDLASGLFGSMTEAKKNNESDEEYCRKLVEEGIKPPARSEWNSDTLDVLRERQLLLNEIFTFNKFALEYHDKIKQLLDIEKTEQEIADYLNSENQKLPKRVIWELEHDDPEIMTKRTTQWVAEDVPLAFKVAQRRLEDMDKFLKPNMVERNIELMTEKGVKGENIFADELGE